MSPDLGCDLITVGLGSAHRLSCEGKAMLVHKDDVPTKGQIRAAVPKHCYVKDTKKSLLYALMSLVEGAVCLGLGFLIPLKLAYLPLWVAYAMITGCVWTGMWVIAHECGHAAFSDNKRLETAVGYLLHTVLLVPYFSWQHSHAVHHANTNHITKGETHVPYVIGGRAGIELPGGEHMMAAARFRRRASPDPTHSASQGRPMAVTQR